PRPWRGPVGSGVRVHPRGCLGPGGHLEDEPNTVHDLFLAGSGDLPVGGDEGDGPLGDVLADTDTDLSGGVDGKQRTGLEDTAATHGRSRVDVFRDGVLHEALRRQDRYAASGHPTHPAEVVDV